MKKLFLLLLIFLVVVSSNSVLASSSEKSVQHIDNQSVISSDALDNSEIVQPAGLVSNERGYAYTSKGVFLSSQENWTIGGCVSFIKNTGWKGYVRDPDDGDIVRVVLNDHEIYNNEPLYWVNRSKTPGETDYTRYVQQTLINLGYSLGSSGADGCFGAATEAAVEKFQKTNGIAADGSVGPTTYYYLSKANK